jgi:environmental stress-induced protein Ves
MSVAPFLILSPFLTSLTAPGAARPSEGAWEKLSQIAVKGAEYDSRERLPYPKCLEGTRVDLLNHIYGLLDNPDKSRLIWLHGTAGVGKSAVAFTIAERMRGLKVAEETTREKRLAGTFFFSRRHTKRCTAGYLFATIAYQLASNFPSIRDDVNRAIHDNPAILDPDKSLQDQMEALFLQPLRSLRLRLHDRPPLVFVVDALDECTSEDEIACLIPLLGRALHEPYLPVIHILLTSRSEVHIHEVMHEEAVRTLVCEIPVQTSGQGSAPISLDGADVDNDIFIFMKHSFTKLGCRNRNFPQPTKDELERLASRAGRRFIVASTMMNFINDGYNDPHDRLQLMLELTSELLPGTEMYKFYDRILSTCANPKRAYLYLSVVATLTDPLPISQISELLGPGEGKDVESALVQLRSVMDIPTDNSLPVNIYHSSIRDYASDPSNCNFTEVHGIMPTHSLLAYSSFHLMIQHLQQSTALLDMLSGLKRQSQAIPTRDPRTLKVSLSFMVQQLEPLQVLAGLLWLQGDCHSDLHSWLETKDGDAWLQTRKVFHWVKTQSGLDWLQTQGGLDWLQTQCGLDWLQTQGGLDWLQTQQKWSRLSQQRWGRWTQEWKYQPKVWLQTQGGEHWMQTQGGPDQLQTKDLEVQTHGGLNWLQFQGGLDWLQTQEGLDWLQTQGELDLLQTQGGPDWLQTQGGLDWLQTEDLEGWLQTHGGLHWLQSQGGLDWLETQGGRDGWLQTKGGLHWLQTKGGFDWLQSQGGLHWLQTQGGRDEWLQTQGGLDWLLTQGGLNWLQTENLEGWLQTHGGLHWLQSQGGLHWLQTQGGRDKWLQTQGGKDWLPTQGGLDWLQAQGGLDWLQAWGGKIWLSTGNDWLQTQGGLDWLLTQGGLNWLQTWGGKGWLQTVRGQDWLEDKDHGWVWLGNQCGWDWLKTHDGFAWLQRDDAWVWLQSKGGQDWLQTSHGQAWQSTPTGSLWLTMNEFSSTVEDISKHVVVPEVSLLPVFKVIQQLKGLPDFVMFPVFLAMGHHHHSKSHLPLHSNNGLIHAMKTFVDFANTAWEESQSTSGALKYACQNWAFHLSEAPKPWDDKLGNIFKVFWNHYLLSWLERQLCLKDLHSCLVILSEGQELQRFAYLAMILVPVSDPCT